MKYSNTVYRQKSKKKGFTMNNHDCYDYHLPYSNACVYSPMFT